MKHGVERFVYLSTSDVYGLRDFHGETAIRRSRRALKDPSELFRGRSISGNGAGRIDAHWHTSRTFPPRFMLPQSFPKWQAGPFTFGIRKLRHGPVFTVWSTMNFCRKNRTAR